MFIILQKSKDTVLEEAVSSHTAALISFLWQENKELEGKAGTNRWSGSSTADNETCATFRRHSRRQEHDNVCSKIGKMCGNK